MMNPKETLRKLKVLLGVEVALETMTLENGVVLEAGVFEAGSEVFIVHEDGNVALPVGEYELDDNKILVVLEEGIIAEIKEKSSEEVESSEETPDETAPSDETELSSATPTEETVETVLSEVHLAKVAELEATIAERDATIVELSKVEVKEEVELAAVPVVHNPELKSKKAVNFSKQTNRKLTTQERVFAQLYKK